MMSAMTILQQLHESVLSKMPVTPNAYALVPTQKAEVRYG